MKSIGIILLIAAGFFTGCVSQPLPREAAGVTLSARSSTCVGVYVPGFQVVEGQLYLRGFVYKQFMSPSTEYTHLDVVYLDIAGRELRVETTLFQPQQLIRRRRMPQYTGQYGTPVCKIPEGTAQIQVRAHDGLHLSG